MIKLTRIGRWMQFEEPINLRLERVIDKKLSYIKSGSQFLPNPLWGIVHLYNSRRRVFPVGLLSLVEPILDSWHKQANETIIIDKGEDKIKPLNVELVHLRPYQIEAFNAFYKNGGGLISLPTSAGKTRIAERIISAFHGDQILIIVPSKELVKQWDEELYGHKVLRNIRIATYQKLYREVAEDKHCLDKYQLVCFDECHHCSASTLYKIGLHCPNATMLGLTATEKRMDGAEMKIQAILGDIIYKVPIQDLVKQGYITQGKVIILNVPKFKAKPDQDYRDIYNCAIVNNEYRNNLIVNTAFESCLNGTVIIMCKQIRQAKTIYEMLNKDCVNEYKNRIIYVDGNSKDRKKIFEKIKNGDYEIIVCTKIYGEGISVPRLKTMIMASGGKSSTEVIQSTGRMLRLFKGKDKAIIYDFKDSGILGRHFRERLKIYKDNGYEVVEE